MVGKQATKIHSKHFILIKSPNFTSIQTDLPINLFFGMKVGGKLGKAVIRNKIKRRIRHIMRLLVKIPKITNNLALIIIPRKGFEKVEFSILLNDFEKALLK